MNQQKLTAQPNPHYDLIVCGSGFSGSVVARRLAENPGVSVLLLAAGGTDDVPNVVEAIQWSLPQSGKGDTQKYSTQPLPPKNLSRILDQIEARLHTELSLAYLAKESGYSRAHFLRMFRAATGLTPHQYVLERRLSKAQQLLRQSKMLLTDIATRCGFSSQTHMNDVFRKQLGVTPREYRRNI